MKPRPPCRVILMGMMGSGKTTVGRLLAERTGWPYHDNDELLLAATGRTARDLALDGSVRLREAEEAAFRLAAEKPPPAIVAAAAGVIVEGELRDLLRDAGVTIWLRAPAATLARRASRGEHRPWLDQDAERWMTETAAAREPMYRSVADQVVDTGQADPSPAVDRIVARLEATTCGPWLGTRLAGGEDHV